MQGYIKLHRKTLENPICMKDTDHLALWVYLLMNATHTEFPMLFRGKKIMLKPGQLITGRKSISKILKLNEHKVDRILKSFENEQQIEQQSSNQNRLLTIINWNDYQQSEQQNEQQVSNKRATDEQRMSTNKNVKKDKNEKKDNLQLSEKPPKKEPDKRISELIEYLKDKAGILELDGTIKQNRFRAHNLLQKLEKLYPEKEAVVLAKQLIDIGLSDPYIANNLTSISYLYYNINKIIQNFKSRQQKNTTVKI